MTDRRTGKRVKFQRDGDGPKKFSLDYLFSVFYDAKVAEGKSPRTLETYRENYRFLTDYMTMQKVPHDVTKITPELIRSYIAWMLTDKRKWEGHAHKREENMTEGLSPVTVNTRLKGPRTMFRFLKTEGLIDNNPFDSVKPVSEPESEIRVMTPEQLKKLLQTPNKRSYAGFRDFVMMNVLLDGFMRIGEVVTLKKSDIDFETGAIHLSGKITKTRRARIVPLQKQTISLLRELIKECEEFDSDFVFLANYGEPITDDQFRNRLKQHAKEAGLKIRIYPHLFRHTAATMALEAGMDMRHVQMILGHADLRMVIKYTHLSTKSIKSQHDLYSPINQITGKLNKERKILR